MNDSENKTVEKQSLPKDAPVGENSQVKSEKTKKAKKKKKRVSAGKIILIIFLVIVLLILAVLFIPPLRSAVFGLLIKNQINAASGGYTLHTVERRDITTTLTGTGTLQPYDLYNVTATVTGDILKADFEEMDEVLEGDPLYVIDSSDLEDDIADMREDVAEALEDYNDALKDYEDLKIFSDYTGTVRDVYVEVGDQVGNGTQIAYIVDSETMVLEIPFFAANTDFLSIGSDAQVTFSSTGEVLAGKVTEISNLTSVNANNSVVRNIKISVENPGGITFGSKAYASAVGHDGNTYYCSGEGTFEYNEEETIVAEASGEVSSLLISEGGRVSSNMLVAELSSEALDNQVEQYKKNYDNQKKALEDLEERLEDYTINAPISGTIVQKNYKVLDTIGSSSMSSTTTLAMIYDMSKLTFDLSIDELDLELIEVGQVVKVTSDSIEGAEFEGVVTKKSIVGSSSGGTTVYPVTVEVEGNDRLLPDMNVNAEIIISSTENVLTVPVSAVKRGNRVEVVKNGNGAALGTVTEKPETELVEVETGASDENYIEIRSGLAEGDVVLVEIVNVTQDAFASMFGAMGGMGAMPSASVRPSGGMQGGMGDRTGAGGGMPGGR